MTSHETYDIAVVGGGIVGSAVAAEAAGRGARVVLVDRADGPSPASTRSFAWLNAVSSDSPHYRGLRVLGVQRHLLEHARWGSGSPYRFTGSLSWAREGALEPTQGAAGAVGIEELHRRDHAAGGAARLIGREEAVRIEPSLGDVPHDGPFLHSSDEGWVDLPDLVGELRRRLVRAGGVVVRTAVELSADGGRVRLEGGPCAETVVIAAGAQTPALLSALGVGIPEATSGAAILVADGLGSAPRGILRTGGISARSHGGGALVLHSTALDAFVDPDGPRHLLPGERVDEVAAAAAEAFGWERPPRVLRALAGARPVPGDGLPVVGSVAGYENLRVAFTHSGATLGLLLGDLLASELVAGEADGVLSPYRPGRFSA